MIERATQPWRSPVWEHYDITLKRGTKARPSILFLVFSCKHNNAQHKAKLRPRLGGNTSGTTNIDRENNKACQPKIDLAMQKYNWYEHLSLIAMRCASSKRAYNSVCYPCYRKEVAFLRPGARIPDPTTVSDDVILHKHFTERAKQYFANLTGSVHVVLDGWTAPFHASYLGICFV